MKSLLLPILVFVFSVCSACQAFIPSGQDPLSGTDWILVSINADANLVGSPPSLAFDGEGLSGNASCNIFQGTYQIEGDGLSLGPLARTEMYCQEPEGVMEQENRYLDALSTADSYLLAEGSLTIAGGGNRLDFQPRDRISQEFTPTADPALPEEVTATAEAAALTPMLDLTLPDGWQEYRDAEAGAVIFIPGDWQINWEGVIAGEYAIFQSYPVDKYTGGEGREPGDTKCDLNLNPSTVGLDELIQSWESSSITTILSDREFTLRSGRVGRRFELDSLGPIRVYTVDFSTGLVKLSCFGDFMNVDEIASWLHEVD